MNILWITNTPVPEASYLMKEAPRPFGGWLVNASTYLSHIRGINLSIAFPRNNISDLKRFQGKRVDYYAFPSVKGRELKQITNNISLEKTIERVKPDIVHIFGTEYPHTLATVNICNKRNVKVVISIQGLVSVIARHYMANLPYKVQRRFTFRDFLKQDNLKQKRQLFIERGKFEVEAVKKINHVIGRTNWDRACTTQINPNVHYHNCNETLRSEFYKHSWDINKCEKYSIFVSQGSEPLKGLHYVLEALPLILSKYPETKLYVGGPNITLSKTIREKLKLSSYGKYINELIKKYHLKDKVVFTGLLDEKSMCEQYLKSNVFVCPSSIENSPNSLGEAMVLGIPCVASDVGGISDMIIHKQEGFIYPSDAPYMLAHYVCDIFRDETLALALSEKAKIHALKSHDRDENTKRLIEIYNKIVGGNYSDQNRGINSPK